jgi:hypothetical protein
MFPVHCETEVDFNTDRYYKLHLEAIQTKSST